MIKIERWKGEIIPLKGIYPTSDARRDEVASNEVRLTEEDIHNYVGIMGEAGVLVDLERWSEGDTLTIYKTKGYKQYKRHYLKVLFDSINENFKLHKSGTPINTTFWKISFRGKDGRLYRGNLKGKGTPQSLTHEKFDCSQLGKEHLEEFLYFYVEDIVRYFIKETTDSSDKEFDDHMWVRMRMLAYFMWNINMLDFLGIEVGKEPYAPLLVMRRALEKVVDTGNTYEVNKGKEVYNEMKGITEVTRYHRRCTGGMLNANSR